MGLMVDGSQVGLVSTDMDKNLFVTCFKPDLKESAAGKQLVRQCDFNIGPGSFLIRCHQRHKSDLEQRQSGDDDVEYSDETNRYLLEATAGRE